MIIDLHEELDEKRFAELMRAKQDQDRMNAMPLWNARPGCQHHVIHAPGGGVRCVKCPGWYCL